MIRQQVSRVYTPAFARVHRASIRCVMKKGPGDSEAFDRLADSRLLQRGIDRRELGVEVGAKTIDYSNDGERNAGSNQAVFDGGSARFILQETRNKVLHDVTPVDAFTSKLVSPALPHRDHDETVVFENCGSVNSNAETLLDLVLLKQSEGFIKEMVRKLICFFDR